MTPPPSPDPAASVGRGALRGARLVGALAGVTVALVTTRGGEGSAASAPGWTLALAVLAGSALVDARTRRLPDRWTALAAAVAVLGVLLPTVVADGSGVLARALASAALTALPYALLWWFVPHGVGFGDVKLAPVLGLLAGTVGGSVAYAAFALTMLLGGAYGVVLLARGAGRGARVALGPWMVLGTTLALLLSPHTGLLLP